MPQPRDQILTRRCVYTCLIGDYERLNEQPVAANSSLDFVCFTDAPGLTSESWRIVPVIPTFPLDHVRSQRLLKILPEEILRGVPTSRSISTIL